MTRTHLPHVTLRLKEVKDVNKVSMKDTFAQLIWQVNTGRVLKITVEGERWKPHGVLSSPNTSWTVIAPWPVSPDPRQKPQDVSTCLPIIPTPVCRIPIQGWLTRAVAAEQVPQPCWRGLKLCGPILACPGRGFWSGFLGCTVLTVFYQWVWPPSSASGGQVSSSSREALHDLSWSIHSDSCIKASPFIWIVIVKSVRCPAK